MTFNVMANNTDDHNKNFAFLLEENGKWQLAPAYDMTFIFNTNGTGPNIERRLSIGGKTSEITKVDLLDFAKQNGIKNANAKINRVVDAIKDFDRYATEYGITPTVAQHYPENIKRKFLPPSVILIKRIRQTHRSATRLEELLIISPYPLIPKDILKSQHLSIVSVTENSYDRIWRSILT